MVSLEDVVRQYQEQFHSQPLLIKACGRINIIGEHTDYNEGFVLPASIGKHIYFAIAENGTRTCHLYAANLNDEYHFDLDSIRPGKKLWANYLMGILQQFQERGVSLEGIDCVFGGDLPSGSGMSSSAALECGFALGISALFQLDYSRLELALLAQRSSQQFVGVPCGIMDQFASLFGRAGQAIKLDCRNHQYEYIPIQIPGHQFVLVNSKVSHELASSAYSQRVNECRQGVKVLQHDYPDIGSLRDVTTDMLRAARSQLDPLIYRRCAFVVQENLRLQEACGCLDQGDVERLGTLLLEAHRGLRDDYEVSCPEVDFLVEAAREHDGVLGARVMGGGFGGSTINLVQQDAVEDFFQFITKVYYKKFNLQADTLYAEVVDGTSLLPRGLEG